MLINGGVGVFIGSGKLFIRRGEVGFEECEVFDGGGFFGEFCVVQYDPDN